jgi:hypothetical protein
MSSSLIFGSQVIAMSGDSGPDNKSLSLETPRLQDDSYGLCLPEFQNASTSYFETWPDEEQSLRVSKE